MRPTILFVDDEPNIINSLRRSLRKEPYKLLSATSGREALQILAQEPVDIVISDERMPGMTGANLVSQIRHQYPEVICMILTGQADFSSAMRSINEAEVFRYLTKPWEPADIIMHVRMALVFKESIAKKRHDMDEQHKRELCRQRMERESPDLFDIERNAKGHIVISTS